MSTSTLYFLIAIVIIFVILIYTNIIDSHKFIQETEPYFRFLMEDDYKFLLSIRYGDGANVEKLYGTRVRNGLIAIFFIIFLSLNRLNFITVIAAVIIGYLVFKVPYWSVSRYYKNHLHEIDLMLPYYLKGLEILIQHYTVPVALQRSIETAPDLFKPGLTRLCQKIESGDSSVNPYMDFAKEYPVRDAMRMMRLLYRLGLGAQENKQEQLMMFSRTVSSLQNKSREQRYKERLDTMENKTMMMLGATGGGILLIMLLAMMMMMNL